MSDSLPTGAGQFVIGVDIGGTFTDTVIVDADGLCVVGKESSTPHDLSIGFFGSIAAGAAKLDLTLEQVLRRTTKLAHGTTAGINAIVTGDIADVALIATSGHGDALKIMGGQGRTLGATIEQLLDFSASDRPDPLLANDRIFEIPERVDFAGDVVVALSPRAVDEIVANVLGLDVEAVAISLLWSFMNPSHEEQLRAAFLAAKADLFLSLGHEVAPRIGEYPRTVSTVLNAQIGPLMVRYIDRIVEEATRYGFAGEILFGTAEGGLAPSGEARRFPISTLQSGPVGGVIASAKFGAGSGHSEIVVTDMGGTTLDVGVIVGSEAGFREENVVERHLAHLRKVDVESVGAGGGSIAWINERSGLLRVGPQSAGADPGPISYGRGGTEVTVTDADLVLGVLNPDKPLAGGLRLDHAAAFDAVAHLGEKLDLDPYECAAGIVEIVDSRMEDLVRRVTLQRGHDPRSFSLWAFGGASGAHAGLYGKGLGVREVVFPLSDLASVWSAYGMTILDQRRTFQTPLFLTEPFDLERFAAKKDALEARARAYVTEHGLSDDVELLWSANLKYQIQFYEVETPLPSTPVGPKFSEALVQAFEDIYSERYGAGTGYRAAGVAVMALRVTVRDPASMIAPRSQMAGSHAAPQPSGDRAVYWNESRSSSLTPIYEGESIGPGAVIAGPAVVEFATTTVLARPGQHLVADPVGNLILRFEERNA